MSTALRSAFQSTSGSKAFICYLTSGFPNRDATVPSMLALQAGGADIIELGVPFSDPIADGPVCLVHLLIKSKDYPAIFIYRVTK
jgi:tryptophan synthase